MSYKLSENDVVSKTRVAIIWVRLRREFKLKSELVSNTLEKSTGVKEMIQILIFLPILRFSGTSLHEVLNSFFVVLSLHFFIAHVKNSDHFVGLQYHFLQYRSRFVIILEVLEKAVTYDDVKFFCQYQVPPHQHTEN